MSADPSVGSAFCILGIESNREKMYNTFCVISGEGECMNKIKNPAIITKIFAFSGMLAVLMYFTHVIVGNLLYPGYDPLAQAVSDLTASLSPAKNVAGIFSTLYGIFVIVLSLGIMIRFYQKVNVPFSVGTLLLVLMTVISFVGYGLFPLSDAGFNGTFSDSMHMVVTILVVVLTIGTLLAFGIGLAKAKLSRFWMVTTFVTLGLMFLGSILTATLPTSLFGLSERISLYSLQGYFIILSFALLRYGKTDPNQNTKVDA